MFWAVLRLNMQKFLYRYSFGAKNHGDISQSLHIHRKILHIFRAYPSISSSSGAITERSIAFFVPESTSFVSFKVSLLK